MKYKAILLSLLFCSAQQIMSSAAGQNTALQLQFEQVQTKTDQLKKILYIERKAAGEDIQAYIIGTLRRLKRLQGKLNQLVQKRDEQQLQIRLNSLQKEATEEQKQHEKRERIRRGLARLRAIDEKLTRDVKKATDKAALLQAAKSCLQEFLEKTKDSKVKDRLRVELSELENPDSITMEELQRKLLNDLEAREVYYRGKYFKRV